MDEAPYRPPGSTTGDNYAGGEQHPPGELDPGLNRGKLRDQGRVYSHSVASLGVSAG